MKFPKWLLIVIVSIGVLWLLFNFVAWPYMKQETKKISSQQTATYTQNDMDLSVNYSSPSKKGRVVFGELVPYDAVWRTGANEPTTFTTTSDIRIADKNLPSGTYSLWTKPGEESWTIIFNKDIPDWGVTLISGGNETTRVPEEDIITVEVPVEETARVLDNFTIDFETQGQLFMNISWDRTKVKVPINN